MSEPSSARKTGFLSEPSSVRKTGFLGESSSARKTGFLGELSSMRKTGMGEPSSMRKTGIGEPSSMRKTGAGEAASSRARTGGFQEKSVMNRPLAFQRSQPGSSSRSQQQQQQSAFFSQSDRSTGGFFGSPPPVMSWSSPGPEPSCAGGSVSELFQSSSDVFAAGSPPAACSGAGAALSDEDPESPYAGSAVSEATSMGCAARVSVGGRVARPSTTLALERLDERASTRSGTDDAAEQSAQRAHREYGQEPSNQHERRASIRGDFFSDLGVRFNALFNPPGADDYLKTHHAYRPAVRDADTQTIWEAKPPPPPKRRRSIFDQVGDMTFVKHYEEIGDEEAPQRPSPPREASLLDAADPALQRPNVALLGCRWFGRTLLHLVSPCLRLPCAVRVQRRVKAEYAKRAQAIVTTAMSYMSTNGGVLRYASLFSAAGGCVAATLDVLFMEGANALWTTNYVELLLALYIVGMEAMTVRRAAHPRLPSRTHHRPVRIAHLARPPCTPTLHAHLARPPCMPTLHAHRVPSASPPFPLQRSLPAAPSVAPAPFAGRVRVAR